jgi:hypothetical protein
MTLVTNRAERGSRKEVESFLPVKVLSLEIGLQRWQADGAIDSHGGHS